MQFSLTSQNPDASYNWWHFTVSLDLAAAIRTCPCLCIHRLGSLQLTLVFQLSCMPCWDYVSTEKHGNRVGNVLLEKWLHVYIFLPRHNRGLHGPEKGRFSIGRWSCVIFSSWNVHRRTAHHILSNAVGNGKARAGWCDPFTLYTGLFF